MSPSTQVILETSLFSQSLALVLTT